jgi:glycerol-3-phosphate acyltransferase PlsY
VAFLLGSFPTGVVLSRAITGRDVRKQGSGNIGAANVARTSGFGVGALVGLIDVLKGALAVWVGHALALPPGALALVAVAAVLGHDYSLFLGFRGGKGVATTLGAAIALAPQAALLSMLSWVVTLVLFRYASLSSLVALALLPIFLASTGRPHPYVAAAAALWLLAAWKHRSNIGRLAAGREPRFRESTRPDGD